MSAKLGTTFQVLLHKYTFACATFGIVSRRDLQPVERNLSQAAVVQGATTLIPILGNGPFDALVAGSPAMHTATVASIKYTSTGKLKNPHDRHLEKNLQRLPMSFGLKGM